MRHIPHISVNGIEKEGWSLMEWKDGCWYDTALFEFKEPCQRVIAVLNLNETP